MLGLLTLAICLANNYNKIDETLFLGFCTCFLRGGVAGTRANRPPIPRRIGPIRGTPNGYDGFAPKRTFIPATGGPFCAAARNTVGPLTLTPAR